MSRKGPHDLRKGLLQIDNVGFPFERMALNIVRPHPKSFTENRLTLVVCDYFTRWSVVVCLSNFQSRTATSALVAHIVNRHGIPLEIHSDQGRTFES